MAARRQLCAGLEVAFSDGYPRCEICGRDGLTRPPTFADQSSMRKGIQGEAALTAFLKRLTANREPLEWEL